ncbi:unnamed protein product [Citrullus colocynthis]|uniref:Uncharacterized protein n=1 Tax=Citrullus colocynthis TaxID=252529 RepID=A0ABP0YGF5_9ROSI
MPIAIGLYFVWFGVSSVATTCDVRGSNATSVLKIVSRTAHSFSDLVVDHHSAAHYHQLSTLLVDLDRPLAKKVVDAVFGWFWVIFFCCFGILVCFWIVFEESLSIGPRLCLPMLH